MFGQSNNVRYFMCQHPVSHRRCVNLSRMHVLGLILLCLFSCARGPELDVTILPVITDVHIEIEGAEISLSADLAGDVSLISECGFILGKKGSNMSEKPSRLSGKTFCRIVTDFSYNTEYQCKAYVGNGRNRIYSDIYTFRTPEEPSTGPEPTPGPEPEPEPDPEPGPYMELSCSDLLIGPDYASYDIRVAGNVKYEVLVPGEVDWLELQIVPNAERMCRLYADINCTGTPRSCEVLFKSLEHDCTLILKLTQESYSIYEVELSYQDGLHNFLLPISSSIGDVVKIRKYDDFEWVGDLQTNFMAAPEIWSKLLYENTGFSSRIARDIVYGTKGTLVLKFIQHSYLDLIEFESPVVKDLCVEAWDTNGDGELSFAEAAKASPESAAGFDRAGYSSFKEFRFLALAYLPSYMFKGSEIREIDMCSTAYGFEIGEGAFLDCAYLNNIGMYTFNVSEKSFMGCRSLEKISLWDMNVPDYAFCGCTSLTSVTIDIWNPYDFYIGEAAFKDCTSLQEINIPIETLSLGPSAFSGCTSLRSVYLLSDTPPSMAPDSFAGTSEFLRFHVPAPLANVYKKAWPQFSDQIVAYQIR